LLRRAISELGENVEAERRLKINGGKLSTVLIGCLSQSAPCVLWNICIAIDDTIGDLDSVAARGPILQAGATPRDKARLSGT